MSGLEPAGRLCRTIAGEHAGLRVVQHDCFRQGAQKQPEALFAGNERTLSLLVAGDVVTDDEQRHSSVEHVGAPADRQPAHAAVRAARRQFDVVEPVAALKHLRQTRRVLGLGTESAKLTAEQSLPRLAGKIDHRIIREQDFATRQRADAGRERNDLDDAALRRGLRRRFIDPALGEILRRTIRQRSPTCGAPQGPDGLHQPGIASQQQRGRQPDTEHAERHFTRGHAGIDCRACRRTDERLVGKRRLSFPGVASPGLDNRGRSVRRLLKGISVTAGDARQGGKRMAKACGITGYACNGYARRMLR
jgi:hypothetical protein